MGYNQLEHLEDRRHRPHHPLEGMSATLDTIS